MSRVGGQAVSAAATENPVANAMAWGCISECVDGYSDGYNLSRQERRVLIAAVRGVADKEIAGVLGVSRNTISTYWKRIFGKTRYRSQREVLAHLLRTLAASVHANENGATLAAVREHAHTNRATGARS